MTVEVTQTSYAPTAATIAYVQVETRVQRYERWSNEHADEAAKLMAAGASEQAIDQCTSSADMWANLATITRLLELALERLP